MTAQEVISATKKELERRIKRCRENGFGSHASALERFLDEYFLKLEAKSKNPFCAENCIGFRQTGKCFADGECEAKRQMGKEEVDLEKELDTWRHEHFHGKRDRHFDGEYLERSSQLALASYFFNLGLNSKK